MKCIVCRKEVGDSGYFLYLTPDEDGVVVSRFLCHRDKCHRAYEEEGQSETG